VSDSPAVENDVYLVAYDELKRLAHRQRRRSGNPDTLNTTALVNEAWMKLRPAVVAGKPVGEFMAIMSHAMRQVLIDHARRRSAGKREHVSITLDDDRAGGVPSTVADLLDLDNALQQLLQAEPEAARVVELRVFGGFEFEDIATNMGVSTASVFRLWRRARVFLLDQMVA
jgi:RNA polymerase sigma factor (TIGR02999 family)